MTPVGEHGHGFAEQSFSLFAFSVIELELTVSGEMIA